MLFRNFHLKSSLVTYKHVVTAEVLMNTLKSAGIPEEKITAELVDTFKQELISKGVINPLNILNKSVEQTIKLIQELIFTDET